MATRNITLPEEMLPELKELARTENRTADYVAAEAVKAHLAKRFWEHNKVQSLRRRGNLTDEQVEEYVDQLVHDSRAESRTS
jgi:predicted transcriptional regulator